MFKKKQQVDKKRKNNNIQVNPSSVDPWEEPSSPVVDPFSAFAHYHSILITPRY